MYVYNCCNINSTLESKSHICSIQIIVYCLGKCDYIEAFLGKQICCLCGAVAAEHYQAVKLKLVIILLHCRDLIEAILIWLANCFEWYTACAENSAAARQDTSEICSGEHSEFAINETLISVFKTVELNIVFGVVVDAL